FWFTLPKYKSNHAD
ncbi:MAG: hypothetical protein GWN30_17595, partial [Gammaproteobacteria bacterium]|nr:hypothetical protein [Gammaproteobacteria bacterium]